MRPLLELFTALFCLGLGMALANDARADDVAQASGTEASSSEWEVSLAAYLWGAELIGDVEADGVETHVDMSFSDILENLNLGAMVFGAARYGRWVGMLDTLFMQLEDDPSFRRSGVFPGVTNTARIDVELNQLLLDLKGGYRLLDRGVPWVEGEDGRRLTLDLLGGGRYWYIGTDIHARASVAGVGFAREVSDSLDWIDPLVGLRVRADLTDRLALMVIGDFGGFGIGSASNSTWQLQGFFGWRVSDRWRLHAGYRALDIRRVNGSGTAKTTTDMQMRGPLLGLSYTF